MFLACRRSAVVEKSRSSPSRITHTTVWWGRPSGMSVATVAKAFDSSRYFFKSSGSAVVISGVLTYGAEGSRRTRRTGRAAPVNFPRADGYSAYGVPVRRMRPQARPHNTSHMRGV